MSNFPADLRYTKEHEWVKVEGKKATVGITEYAAEQLGDVVLVELPGEGIEFSKGDSFGVIESVKSVSDIYAPLSGKIIESNDMLPENPGIINEDCYGEGWIAKIELDDESELSQLLSAVDYEKFLSEEA
jgi:glycine cleavage system H protein